MQARTSPYGEQVKLAAGWTAPGTVTDAGLCRTVAFAVQTAVKLVFALWWGGSSWGQWRSSWLPAQNITRVDERLAPVQPLAVGADVTTGNCSDGMSKKWRWAERKPPVGTPQWNPSLRAPRSQALCPREMASRPSRCSSNGRTLAQRGPRDGPAAAARPPSPQACGRCASRFPRARTRCAMPPLFSVASSRFPKRENAHYHNSLES